MPGHQRLREKRVIESVLATVQARAVSVPNATSVHTIECSVGQMRDARPCAATLATTGVGRDSVVRVAPFSRHVALVDAVG